MAKSGFMYRYGTGILFLILSAAILITSGCATNTATVQGQGSPPQFVDAYAAHKMPSGGWWRIYVEGYDPDGDMARIHAVTSQLEGERWRSQIITLDKSEGGRFAGYISLWIPYFSGTSTVEVELLIVDSAGNKSAWRKESVRIGYNSDEMLPQKWLPVADNQIANLFFKVRNPNWDNSNAGQPFDF